MNEDYTAHVNEVDNSLVWDFAEGDRGEEN
jgi:hypothetical protein